MNRRREMTMMLAAGAFSLVGIMLVWKGPTIADNRARSHCQSNLKQIGLALNWYMRDYDEMAPPGNAWSEVLLIHNRKPESFLCPRRGALPQGYAMHSALAGAPQSAIDFPAKSISFFDVDARGNDVLDDGKLLPRPPRHFDGNNIAFVDGHVKWMQNPDFKFGYDAKFAKRNSEARAASAKFWAEYQAKQRAKQRKVAAQKKAVKP